MKKIFYNKGAVSILLGVLLLGVLLSIGLAMSFLMVRQMKMSRQIGQSVIAFYAADAGAERCLYELREGTGVCPSDGTIGAGEPYEASYEVITAGGGTGFTSLGVYKEANRKVEVDLAP